VTTNQVDRRCSLRIRLLGACLALSISLAGCGGAVPSAAPTALAATQPASSSAAADRVMALPAEDGAIEAGSYRVGASPWSVADYTVTVADGWNLQYGQIFVKYQDTDREFGFYPVVVDRIYVDACLGSNGAEVTTGTTVDELSNALVRQDGARVSVTPTQLGGLEGVRVDIAVKDGFDLSQCNLTDVGLQVWYSAPADKYFVLLADAAASAYILDVAGERQVFLTQVGAQATEADRTELQRVLDSIRIGP
jgi:hypothetical protein